MSSEIVNLSAEDAYTLVDMSSSDKMFPHPFTFGNFGAAVTELRNQWKFLWDFRGNEDEIYNDIQDAFDESRMALNNRRVIIAKPEHYELAREAIAKPGDGWSDQVIKMRHRAIPSHGFALSIFEDGTHFSEINISDAMLDVVSPQNLGEYHIRAAEELGISVSSEEALDYAASLSAGFDPEEYALLYDSDEEMEAMAKKLDNARARQLGRFLDLIGANSLLSELAIAIEGDRVKVIPYHSFSLHAVPTRRDNLVLVRPGRRSSRYWRRFKKDIRDLETLLNTPGANERDFELLLLRNPLFLRGLNYRKVYPQVVLPLGAKDSLRPDVIAEPVDSEWCHIIDFKLPSQRVIVGRDNRLCLAAGIHEVAAQLREYSHYFDDRKTAKLVESHYGFKCHKPKLVAIVGRDPQDLDAEQVRRAMTSFPELDVVTYDRLLRAAKNYLRL